MKDLASLSIDTAKALGASYADIRIIDTRNENLGTYNGNVDSINLSSTLGFGVRVICSVKH